ncbi:MAG: hypothetical protein F4Z01_00630 [Gammaproteobacteria bacterium]|nr:hypothetical protein [Gammaproteobacteria bacterium]MYF38995.1 hypothetical protein [Gammaproteobacteria bacterium]
MDSNSSQQIRLIYILYIIGAFIWLVLLVGVILAYIEKGKETESVLLSHLRRQIRIFWVHLVAAIVGGIVLIVLIVIAFTVTAVGAGVSGGDPAAAAAIGTIITSLLMGVYGLGLIIYVIVASVKGLKSLDAGEPMY